MNLQAGAPRGQLAQRGVLSSRAWDGRWVEQPSAAWSHGQPRSKRARPGERSARTQAPLTCPTGRPASGTASEWNPPAPPPGPSGAAPAQALLPLPLPGDGLPCGTAAAAAAVSYGRWQAASQGPPACCDRPCCSFHCCCCRLFALQSAREHAGVNISTNPLPPLPPPPLLLPSGTTPGDTAAFKRASPPFESYVRRAPHLGCAEEVQRHHISLAAAPGGSQPACECAKSTYMVGQKQARPLGRNLLWAQSVQRCMRPPHLGTRRSSVPDCSRVLTTGAQPAMVVQPQTHLQPLTATP